MSTLNLEDQVSYPTIINHLSNIWAEPVDSCSYLKSSDWIDSNMNRILEAIDNRITDQDHFSLSDQAILHIILNLKLFTKQPKWLTMLESLFKSKCLDLKMIESIILDDEPLNGKSSDLDPATCRGKMIYFRLLVNSLGLVEKDDYSIGFTTTDVRDLNSSRGRTDKVELSIGDFIKRASWARIHSAEIIELFEWDTFIFKRMSEVFSKLDQTILLTNRVLQACSDLKVERELNKIVIHF